MAPATIALNCVIAFRSTETPLSLLLLLLPDTLPKQKWKMSPLFLPPSPFGRT
jgi:hypothetical protein